jgi:hypothetical protein
MSKRYSDEIKLLWHEYIKILKHIHNNKMLKTKFDNKEVTLNDKDFLSKILKQIQ